MGAAGADMEQNLLIFMDVSVCTFTSKYQGARMLKRHYATHNESLSIEIRPRCPKCKKEFMLNLRNYLPGKQRACFACGTVTQFDSALAERVQKQIRDLEVSIQEVFESFGSA